MMAATVSLVLCTVISVLIIYLVQRWFDKRKYNLPPGPTPLPILGNLLTIGKVDYIFKYFTDLGKIYGEIFTVYMGPNPCIILNSMEAVKEAYIRKSVEFANRPVIFSTELLGEHSVLMAQHTPELRMQRKISFAALRKYASGRALEELLEDNMEEFTRLVEQEQGKPFNPLSKLTLMIYNIVMSMVFGKRLEYEDPFFQKVSRNIDKFNEAFGNGFLEDIFPIRKYFPNKTADLFRHILSDIKDYSKQSWNEHMESFNPDEQTDFVYHLIACKLEAEREEGQEANMTEDHYHMILLAMFFAATDTTRITIYTIIGMCVQYPEVQDRIHQEIDQVIGRDQQITAKHRNSLPYTEAVIHEVMRLWPVTPLSIPRATSCDVELLGYHIPKGTMVMPNVWALHYDPKEWPEPEVFQPERHLDESGVLAPESNSYLPFSTGRRVCVGEAFAKAELHVLVAKLFQRFTFLPPPGKEFKLEMSKSIFLQPLPFELVAKLRD